MRGGIDYQVNRLFLDSGIFSPGTSKHDMKIEVRATWGVKNWHEVAQHLPIYSFGTAESYKDVWHRFARWGKAELGLMRIESTNESHIIAYLEHCREQGVQWSYFQKVAAALEKLGVALNWYARATGSGNRYSFSDGIRNAAKEASRELEHGKYTTRAYPDPRKLITELPSIQYKLKAALQLEGGCRISETFIKPDQLKGINAMGQGIIQLEEYNCKGGKVRQVKVSRWTYENMKRHIDRLGEFNICDRSYAIALGKAAEKSGQPYTGPHGLRWNYAQWRMHEIQVQGFTYEYSLHVVSMEMGHVRPSITERYLK